MSGMRVACAGRGRDYSRSNLAKHRKRCGKPKVAKTRSNINRNSYARNQTKILAHRRQKKAKEIFQLIEGLRNDLKSLDATPFPAKPEPRGLPTQHPLYAISTDAELFLSISKNLVLGQMEVVYERKQREYVRFSGLWFKILHRWVHPGKNSNDDADGKRCQTMRVLHIYQNDLLDASNDIKREARREIEDYIKYLNGRHKRAIAKWEAQVAREEEEKERERASIENKLATYKKYSQCDSWEKFQQLYNSSHAKNDERARCESEFQNAFGIDDEDEE
ncbi:hypothetical protein FI667_g5680, partial [Globisporangium splendens]